MITIHLKNKLEQQEQLISKVSKWPERLKKLSLKGMTEKQFCELYNINQPHLSRAKAFNPMPRKAMIDIVEAALLKEGV